MFNTKLTDNQKAALRHYKEAAIISDVACVNLDNKSTMAFSRSGTITTFSLAIMSDEETKYRFKVGAYYALSRFFNEEVAVMSNFDFNTMIEACWGFNDFESLMDAKRI